MKIISKFKDYYDYLVGIYGVDEKLVLDRTEFTSPSIELTENSKVRFYICGFIVEGLFKNGKFLYQDELIPYCKEHNKRRFWWNSYMYEDFYHINDQYILKKPIKSKVDHNEKLKCPILKVEIMKKLFNDDNNFSKFPILKAYDFHKVFSAEEIWLMLSEWLGRERPIVNKLTNNEKIITHGFDLKTSFRNL